LVANRARNKLELAKTFSTKLAGLSNPFVAFGALGRRQQIERARQKTAPIFRPYATSSFCNAGLLTSRIDTRAAVKPILRGCCAIAASGQDKPMSDPVTIFERAAVRRNRARAAHAVGAVMPILDEAAERLLDRLDDTKMRFSQALDLGGRGAVAPQLLARGMTVVSADLAPNMAARAGGIAVAGDAEFLPFADASFDLIVALLSLHWINDLPGALVQIRRALKPNGFFLASIPVLPTLGDLRASLIDSEVALTGGASPRVSPFPELRDCAGLLQRAGFTLPVADIDEMFLSYASPLGLLRDLQAAGERNAVLARAKTMPPRAMFGQALAALAPPRGRLEVTLHIANLSGWA
jgi:SAM-dependent methyltransferase